MTAFSYGVQRLDNNLPSWLIYTANGLTSAALGLVALAAYKLSAKILAQPATVVIGVVSASIAINFSQSWLYPLLVVSGGVIFYLFEFFKVLLSEASAK
jgi:chromate transport protein ChrA